MEERLPEMDIVKRSKYAVGLEKRIRNQKGLRLTKRKHSAPMVDIVDVTVSLYSPNLKRHCICIIFCL